MWAVTSARFVVANVIKAVFRPASSLQEGQKDAESCKNLVVPHDNVANTAEKKIRQQRQKSLGRNNSLGSRLKASLDSASPFSCHHMLILYCAMHVYLGRA